MEHFIDTFPGTEILIDRKKFFYFGGTAYLGLQFNKGFQDIHSRNIKKYGTSYGASRKSNVRFSIFDQAEQFLADWVGSEACTTLSSGYLAAQLVSSCFISKKYKPFHAPNCHTALFASGPDKNKIKSYSTYTSLKVALQQHLVLSKDIIPVVFLDSIDFSGTNFPGFEGIRSLPLHEVILVVDDSHGIGVIGPKGAGSYPLITKLNPKELLVCCSLGKALGIQSGAIFGSQKRIQELTDTDFFGGASPAAPASIATLLEGWDFSTKSKSTLKGTYRCLLEGLKNLIAISKIPEYPAFSYSDNELTQYLYRNNIIVTDFSYPNRAASLTSRIVLTASHSKEQLQYLSKLLKVYFY